MQLLKYRVIFWTVVILAFSVFSCMSQISENFIDHLTPINIGDETSFYIYEEEGISYFFDKDSTFLDIISFDYEGDIIYGFFLGEDKIQFLDSDFNYITTSEWPYKDDNIKFARPQTPPTTEVRFNKKIDYSIIYDEDYFDIYENGSLYEDSQYLGRYSRNEYNYGSPYSYRRVNNPYSTDAPELYASDKTYLGKLSSNQYDYESISNSYGAYGSAYSPTSINNPYGKYGSPYSPNSATNPYSTNAPKLYAPDRTYLGKLSTNQYDCESISNPYGPYGSSYSPTSINNPYGKYGNPFSTDAPLIIWEED